MSPPKIKFELFNNKRNSSSPVDIDLGILKPNKKPKAIDLGTNKDLHALISPTFRKNDSNKSRKDESSPEISVIYSKSSNSC